MHPTLAIKGTKSQKLAGKKIVVGVTGSIAAVEALKLCRELVRHGAEVHAVMSEAAEDIVSPEALHFACGRPPVTWIDGGVQHVELFSMKDRADLFVISPCTANTIGKIATGVDDTPVTTYATTAIGAGVPILVVPAMDLSMWKHPLVRRNLRELQRIGAAVVGPLIEENKAKIVPYKRIVAEIIRAAGPRDLAGKKVLVIAGATGEPIDDVRIITNRSSGETGVELAKAAYERGAEVELWMGRCESEIPGWIPARRFESTADLVGLVKKMGKFEAILMPAAVSDYTVAKKAGKLPSEKGILTLTLTKTPKVLGEIRRRSKALLVGFKLETGVSDKELHESAAARLKQHGLDMIVANRMQDVTKGSSRVLVISPQGPAEALAGSKKSIAWELTGRVASRL